MQIEKLRAPKQRDLIGIYQPVLPDLARVEKMLRSASVEALSPVVRELFGNARGSENIVNLLSYSLSGSGKRLRPALTLLSGKLFHYDPGSLLALATSIEILHTATLVHDDIIDKSLLRRGKPTINALWNSDRAILTGDYLFSKSLEFVANIRNNALTCLFVQNLLVLCSGELTQNFNSFNTRQTREHYFNTIGSKTAALFSLATEGGAILGLAPEDSTQALKQYGYDLGMAFQIVDDILDFVGDEKEMGKPKGSDLSQGIITLPAMMLMDRYPRDNPVSQIEDGDKTENVKQAVTLILEDPRIIEDCYTVAVEYADKARSELESLPRGESRDSLLDLADFAINRTK
jgi:octaprenyl-diphosphate synthase